LFAAKRISANEAKQLGLIQETIGEKPLMERAVELAEECVSKTAPLANKYLKSIAFELRQSRFQKILDLESKFFGEIFESADKKEGVGAFLEKRSAQFSGN
jgi:enoyl-CoA hydratase